MSIVFGWGDAMGDYGLVYLTITFVLTAAWILFIFRKPNKKKRIVDTHDPMFIGEKAYRIAKQEESRSEHIRVIDF